MNIVTASAEHFAAVAALLAEAQLATEDLNRELPGFVVVLDDGGDVVATGGLEPLEDGTGLIRSLVVHQSGRNHGLGSRVYAHLEQQARDTGVTTLYLLSETAEAFFEQRGYSYLERATAPEALRRTAQFSSLCPSNCAVMFKTL